MNRFFAGCYTEVEIKRRYRELAKKHHPDLGGDAELFKLIAAEYSDLKAGNETRTPIPAYPTWKKVIPKWGRVKRKNAINRLVKVQRSKGLKKMFVFYAYKDLLEKEQQAFGILDLELIAAALEYKPGWVEFKKVELNLK